ncbi:MAG: Gfo/Idh/MocA family oxidoreductase [Planctomycetia bacterium]|nr:Gfo/Idh/MocA family oxidoreductase [Planctomycetia bacterium]
MARSRSAKQTSSRPSRRDFLKTSAVVGSGFFIADSYAQVPSKSANERVRLACIGVGGKGGSDTDQAADLCDLVALCDCDENTLNGKAKALATKDKRFADAKLYTDYRKLFDEVGKSIDAVTISTPDHTHAGPAMRALKSGIHTYVQKPLSHTVFEARIMRETAAEKKLVTQMGNQGSAENGLREAVEVIQSGAIGPVREAHIWTNRPIWPQAPDVMARPDYTDEIPKTLDWESFIGPAPMRPYVARYRNTEGPLKGKNVYHSFAWRGWLDYGTGALGDMGCHTANMTFRALKLGSPISVEAQALDVNGETFPSASTVTFQFPARGDMPACKVVWYEGKVKDKEGKLVKNLPTPELLQGETPPGSGSLLVGDKGTLYSPNDYGAAYVLYPKKEFVGYQKPSPTIPRNGGGDKGMKQEWVTAIQGGPATYSGFDVAGMLTEFILLGNVAVRTGKKLEWDGPGCKVTNCPEAEQYIRKEYRKGWEL